MSRFDEVQTAALRRSYKLLPLSREDLAAHIVATAQGDARLAYDYLDAVNRHLTRMLQGSK